MSDQPLFMFYVEGREYDAGTLTLDEVEAIENAFGGDRSLEELNLGRSEVLKAIAFELLKRDDPDVTMESIGKIRRLSLLENPASNGAQPGDDTG